MRLIQQHLLDHAGCSTEMMEIRSTETTDSRHQRVPTRQWMWCPVEALTMDKSRPLLKTTHKHKHLQANCQHLLCQTWSSSSVMLDFSTLLLCYHGTHPAHMGPTTHKTINTFILQNVLHNSYLQDYKLYQQYNQGC